MEQPDPLEHIEQMVSEMHQTVHRQTQTAHKKYPLLFLLLITASVAAVFHGLDRLMDYVPYLNQYPEILVLLGVLGLFFTGTLYKRLGKDRFD